MKHRLCCIFNYPSHYRFSIYKKMEESLQVDYYFGNRLQTNIKPFDVKKLNSFKGYLRNKFFRGGYYQKGLLSLYFSGDYNKFLITGESRNISLWIILLLNLYYRKDISLWTHGWYGKETGLKKILKKFFLKLASHCFLYGEYAKKLMIKEGFDENKLTPIYNSLEYYNQVKIRELLHSTPIYEKHFGNSYPILCYIGRLQKIKKIELIIDALLILEEKDMMCNLIIIGGGDYQEELISYVEKKKLSKRVWFYGPSYDEQKNGELLFNADLCISPGNVGLTAIHAMTYGCPVITHSSFEHQMPEFEAVKPNITGDFFEEDNVSDLAEKTLKWLCSLRKRVITRNNCYQMVDGKYNPDFQAGILKNIYENTSNK